jgi:hypothetical protein
MQPFTRTIDRVVSIKASDPALEDTEWVIHIGPEGLSVRRRGEGAESAIPLTWRSIIGHALIHPKRRTT